MKKYLLLVLISLCTGLQIVFADSPLTSTSISSAYKKTGVVKKALKSKGQLTPKLMRYLADASNPLELRIAVINALGWNVNGQNNATLFFSYLQKQYQYLNVDDFLKRADGETILCLAYLKAMDNYADVSEALVYAKEAKSKSDKSYTVHLIAALIESQKVLNENWCKVYQLTNNVRTNNLLTSDMKAEAVKIIFDYMDLYKSSCD